MGLSGTESRLAHDCRALLLVDHGSRRAAANALLGEVAARVRDRIGPGGIVEAAHMEIAAPTIVEGFTRCVEQGATQVIVHPFMLAPGRHVSEDLPRLVAEAAQGHTGIDFIMAAPLGSHPGIIEAVLARCESAVSEPEPGDS